VAALGGDDRHGVGHSSLDPTDVHHEGTKGPKLTKKSLYEKIFVFFVILRDFVKQVLK
jgi:hypothetical protein